MEKFFHIKERGSTFRTEVMAGLTTFMTMAYILMVNSKMFAELPGVSYNAIYIATAVSAVIGTVLIGILANLPLAQASAMGTNAFFVYTVCIGFGLHYANALVLILLDGIVFLLLTVTGLRQKLLEAIPKAVRVAIPGGIGLFIAFIGLKDSGLVVPDSATYVNLASGFDFSDYLTDHSGTELFLLIFTSALAFCLVDMFDTIGTLYGVCARGNLLTAEGEVPNVEKAMLADSIATVCGAVCGTSTVSNYVEASAGIAEGGKTGFSAIVTGGLFFLAMFFSPIASLVPGCATSAALIYVGIMMMNCVRQIDWLKTEEAVPAFLTVALMPMTYNISNGIAFGVISYVLIHVFMGKRREIKAGTWVIAGLFTVMFFVTH